MADDVFFMNLAIREAKKGLGRTSPNPCVGAVIVKNGEIVGRGYHRKAGTPHAEINALRAAGDKAKAATLYVTLEPCNHTGRTPPCTRAILESGIKKVVVGMPDPNPKVAGGGCKFLAAHGITVIDGVLADRCRAFNRPFIKHVTTGMPWVIMKAGMSIDGRIAPASRKSGWITSGRSRRQVHIIRDRVDAIAVGVGTALNDDPSLTTRLPAGRGRDPVRVVLDTHLRLPLAARVVQQDSAAETVVFCGPDHDAKNAERLKKAGVRVVPVALGGDGHLDLRAALKALGAMQLNSLLVEGGSRIHGAFLRSALVDEVNIFMAPFFIGADGVPVTDALGLEELACAARLRQVRTRRLGDDVFISGIFTAAHVA